MSRQYSEQLDKVDRCQVAVYGALSAGEYYSLIDTRLYLPREWTDNIKRCQQAGVPDKEISHRTKPELAIEILSHQQRIGTRFDWVVADGLYGHDSEFRKSTDALGIKYMYDVHNDDSVYLECPEIFVPKRTAAKGRTPVRLKASTPSYKVLSLAKNLEETSWKEFHIRNTTKGRLKAKI